MTLEQAIATIILRKMSEDLSGGEVNMAHVENTGAVLSALKQAWPDEYERSRNLISFAPVPSGGGVAGVVQ